MRTVSHNHPISLDYYEAKELETILTFLGIEFIDYKGRRCSNGHKTAKTVGEIREFFGKEVMASGQYIEDIHWWNFKSDWNDLMMLISQIENILYNFHLDSISEGSTKLEEFYKLNLKGLYYSNDELTCSIKNLDVYNSCVEFIEWFNKNNSK